MRLTDSDAQVCFGPNQECCMQFEPGPPPKIESTCEVVEPPSPPPPSSPPPFDRNVVFDGYSTGTMTSPAPGQLSATSENNANGMFATVTIDSLDGPLRGAAITCQTGSQWSMGLTAKSPSGYSGNNDWAYFLPHDNNDNSYGFHGVRVTAYLSGGGERQREATAKRRRWRIIRR